jgi:tetratricopeptide (TPR) repeat protein
MKHLVMALIGVLAIGCAAPRPPVAAPPPGPVDPHPPIDGTARAKFDAALALFVHHDQANDWDTATCNAVAAMFDDAAAAQRGPYVQATYDAGLAFQRCNDDKNARARFEKASKDDPSFDAALARLALYRFKQDANADAAIDAVQHAVAQGEFKNAAALVDLATMQMTRDGEKAAPGCKDDMECARLNLQRALAIDDAYMPALNQLGLYYLQLAKKRAGVVAIKARGTRGRQLLTSAAPTKRADVQQLELAALVCSQAIAKDPSYATIHNTAGLVMNELGQVNGAVEQFALAAKLDPKFFEAQMNYAAVNLSFRGFEQAQRAYTKALEMRPNDYDAHLGLALALRGQLTGTEPDYAQRVAAVERELDAAKKSDADRPDAWFNEGILTQEFETRGATDAQALAALDRAEKAFQHFIDKARGKSEYDGAVTRAKERIEDIGVARTFVASPKAAPKSPASP